MYQQWNQRSYSSFRNVCWKWFTMASRMCFVRVTWSFIAVLWEGGMLRIAGSHFDPNFKYISLKYEQESPLPTIFWAIDCFVAPLWSLGLKSLPLNVWRISWHQSKYDILVIACWTLITPEQFMSFSLSSWSAEWNNVLTSSKTSLLFLSSLLSFTRMRSNPR